MFDHQQDEKQKGRETENGRRNRKNVERVTERQTECLIINRTRNRKEEKEKKCQNQNREWTQKQKKCRKSNRKTD
jgi:hypothetical protein